MGLDFKSNLFLKFIFYFLFFTNSCTKTEWIDTLPKPWTLSEAEISKILPKFHEKYPDFHDRLLAFWARNPGPSPAAAKSGSPPPKRTKSLVPGCSTRRTSAPSSAN